MDLGIEGKIALVTAASKGLGRASAEALSAEGCRVAICSRSENDINAAADEIAGQTGNEVLPFVADMSRMEDISRLQTHLQEQLGNPEILVVNAGGPPFGNFDQTPLDSYSGAMELTLMSGIRLTHTFISAMRQKGWGRIVFISSISVKHPLRYLILSNTARAGLTGFMKSVATEVAAEGVTLNAVLPGQHATKRVTDANREAPEQAEALRQAVPMKRMGEPHELAAMVAFFASAKASYITGASILLDGGLHPGLF